MLVSTNRPTSGCTDNIHTLMVTSEAKETVDTVTKIGLLILAEIKREELATQMVVTGTGTENSQTYKQCTNDLWIYLGLQNLCFLKKWMFFLVDMWILVFNSGQNYLSIFLRSNDIDLNVLHNKIKLNNEVANFW